MTEAVAMKLQAHSPIIHKRVEGVFPAVTAVKVDDYIAFEVRDPDSKEVTVLLLSRNQWDVAADRAKKRQVTFSHDSAIPGWKAAALKFLGFKFV